MPESEATVGDDAPCVYCDGIVTLNVVDYDPLYTDANGKKVVGDAWCEGTCRKCGEHVEYDYDPVAHPHRPIGGP